MQAPESEIFVGSSSTREVFSVQCMLNQCLPSEHIGSIIRRVFFKKKIHTKKTVGSKVSVQLLIRSWKK